MSQTKNNTSQNLLFSFDNDSLIVKVIKESEISDQLTVIKANNQNYNLINLFLIMKVVE